MSVLENALGGGFQSRLFNRVRTQRGLAYAAGAQSGAGFERPGTFLAYSLTKSESTMVATDLVREEVERVTREPVSEDETRVARESALNALVFQFENPSQVLFRSAFYELAGYPQDFLQRYQKGLEGVTSQTMLEAAKRKIHPENLVTVIVGREKDFDRKLESLGQPVERADISIPPPPSKLGTVETAPDAAAKGRALLEKAAAAAGGAAAWRAIKSVAVDEDATISIQGQSLQMGMQISWLLPDRRVAVQKLPFGEVTAGVEGARGWLRSPQQGLQDQPEASGELKQEYERSLFHILGHPEDLDVQALAQPETIEGVRYDVAIVKSPEVRDWKLYFAPGGELARMEFEGRGPAGPARETVVSSDWRPVSGIRYPYGTRVLLDGQPFLEGKVTVLKINPPLTEEMFKKPAK